ncbi:hypothetical protein [uncultured Winogradskyella sp.]|uniref:hypothetical protein n=1 Tax=uncultured Winogradskyella sp. TaxID=395353 RepID=UPI00262800E7|nr:hypothetical protein [uncultured Winogradskyella sp.]
MRSSVLVLLLFNISIAFSQKHKINTSDLLGYWTYNYRINEPESIIIVYRRAYDYEKRTLLFFNANGLYSMEHFWKSSRKCGNEIRPKNKYGTYILDYDNKTYIYQIMSQTRHGN